MAVIQDHEYLKLCAQLASYLSISQASARRKVDLVAAKEDARDLKARKEIAERLLNKARLTITQGQAEPASQFDHLLEALAEEENFMVED